MGYRITSSPGLPKPWGCILLLIDQSASMAEPFPGESHRSKAERLAGVVNSQLNAQYRLTKSLQVDPAIWVAPDDPTRHSGLASLLQSDFTPWEVVIETCCDHLDFGMVGYGGDPRSTLGGRLAGRGLVPYSDLIENPLRFVAEDSVQHPLWLEPVADNGTPMCAAIRYARAILQDWIEHHPSAAPPVVINVTDGAATDGDALLPAHDLRSLGTKRGSVVLCNFYLSSHGGGSILFPDSSQNLPNELTRQLWEMSSMLPDAFQEVLNVRGYRVKSTARAYVHNAGGAGLAQILDLPTIALAIARQAGALSLSG